MFTNAILNASNWLQQKDHGSSIDTRPVLDSFSFGSRWVLVRLSFVSRCLFVSLSRTERGLNEFRTKEGRKKIEKMTENHRRLDGKLSCLMGVAVFCFPTLSQMS